MHVPAPVRIAVLGCGNVLGGYRGLLDQLHARRLALVTRACGRPHQRAAVADLLPHAGFSTDESDVLQAPDADLVLVLTSMPEHPRLVRAALEAGKHVVVEKPFAPDLATATSLIDLARQRERLLVAAPFTTLSPTFQAMARRVRQGEIGRVVSARSRYGWAGPDWSDWFYRPGGGCLFDLGIYGLTTITGFLGPARRVVALAGVAIPERSIGGRLVHVEAEDNAQVLLDFGEGRSAVVTCGFTLQQYRGPALELYGTSGTLQMLGDDWDPDGYELWLNSLGAWQLHKESAPEWPWTDGLRHAVEALALQRPLQLSLDHARHVIEIIGAARASAGSGRAINLTTSFAELPLPEASPPEPAHRVHDRTRVYPSDPA